MKKARKRPASGRARGSIAIKRVYDEASASDGQRILIDRLWPRGIAKAALRHDAWMKDLAPSNALRNWYQHDPKKFREFRRRYLAELKANADMIALLRASIRGRKTTLLTSTREVELSHATVLAEMLSKAT